MHSELIDESAVDLAGRIRSRDVSSEEVVTAHLDRIDAVNDEVNAIVSRRSRAEVLAEAREKDTQEPLGPLHGLPVAVKDLEDAAGLPTRAGSVITPERPVDKDGIVASRFRAAGAIIIGKTNVPEFGCGSHTFNNVFGVTRNPWNLHRSAGGSSGGAAAALASRMVPIADGSDLGGSLRNPAGFCNVVGLRPSIGRVPSPTERSTHLLRLAVQGPMGRTVADTALVLSALAGPDRNDPLSYRDDPASFRLGEPARPDLRIAWGGDLGLFTVQRDVLALCRAAVDSAADAGAGVAETAPDLSSSMHAFRVMRGLLYRDIGDQYPSDRRDHLKKTLRDNMAYGHTLTVADVLTAERERAELHHTMSEFFVDHDVLALPTAQVAPFPVETEYPVEIEGQPMADYLEWMTTCCVITTTGCPAISIPAGFTADGLPVGLQLVAPVGNDRELLVAAQAIEAVIPHYREAPPLTYR